MNGTSATLMLQTIMVLMDRQNGTDVTNFPGSFSGECFSYFLNFLPKLILGFSPTWPVISNVRWNVLFMLINECAFHVFFNSLKIC